MTNRSSTAEDILNCTRRLIASGGYNGFSYADISEVVGIRKASIHHHFPSKADLVRAFARAMRAADGILKTWTRSGSASSRSCAPTATRPWTR